MWEPAMQSSPIVRHPDTIRRVSLRTFAIAGLLAAVASSNIKADQIERRFVNPATGYTQVVSVTANGVTTLFVSGQVSEGNSIETQLRGAYTSLREQLTDAGGALSDIVKLTTYIVDYQATQLDVFRQVRNEFFAQSNRPASTLIGVAALALPEYRVEIEATAILSANAGEAPLTNK
ncbi:MAG: enamine deaminase RidA (YjgF/YER057c/UK114 family) [Gammaproteobacteria bacterium]|jgi:enamine deaminase RidA (YjgF/YER057c/UK114 family)